MRRREDKRRTLAYKRLKKLPTTEVLNWADSTGSGIVKALDDYRRLGQAVSLEEAKQGLWALIGVVDALEERV
jgi:hypothetical protein